MAHSQLHPIFLETMKLVDKPQEDNILKKEEERVNAIKGSNC